MDNCWSVRGSPTFFFFLSIAKPTQTVYQISYNEHQLIPVQPGHDPLEIRINKN